MATTHASILSLAHTLTYLGDDVFEMEYPTPTPTPPPTPTPTPPPTPTPTPTPPPTPTPTPTPCVYSDDFSGDLSNWNDTTNWQISGGDLHYEGGPAVWGYINHTLGAGCTDHYAAADVYWDNDAARCGVICRYADSNNYYHNRSYGGIHYLMKLVGGSQSTLASGSAGTSSGAEMKIQANGTTIDSWANSHYQQTDSDLSAGLGVGCRCYNGNGTSDNGRFDNFDAGPAS